LEEVLSHVVIQRPFVVTHRVFVQPAASLREWAIEKLLSLPAKSSLENNREPSLQFMLLAGNQCLIILSTKNLAKGSNVAEQRAGRFHVLYEAPQFCK
jgi:hypothetical protein